MKLTALFVVYALLAGAASGAAAAESASAAATAGPAAPSPAPTPVVNLSHFNHLYADLALEGRAMGVLHIYAQHPNYTYAIEPKEGYACVDDVARGLVLLSREWRHRPDAELQRKVRRLAEFVLHLQHRNGYFNNFLWGDGRINTRYKTSVAELNWWSLRALWGLEEAYPVLQHDKTMATRIRTATERLVANLERDLGALPRRTTVASGLKLPTWLPAGSGADQAAEAIVALLPHQRRTGNPRLLSLMAALADGILLMQHGDAHTYPYGQFLSWRNTWHAWGNVQAYALLMAGERLGRPDYTASALREVDNFYPYLLNKGYLATLELRGDAGTVTELHAQAYPQIAYGLRPMVFAAAKAYALTHEPKYRDLALALGAWLSGRNVLGTPVYDPQTGIVFDGINGPDDLNRNAGAESTVEALLVQQALRDELP